MVKFRWSIFRVRVAEILKFIVAAGIGFTLRVMIDATCNGSKEIHCVNSVEPKHPFDIANLEPQLRESFSPRTPSDVIEYRFLTLDDIFDSHGASPRQQLKSYHLQDLKDVIGQTMNFINYNDNRYRLKRLHSAFERIDPLRGKEYIMDLEVSKPSSNQRGYTVPEFFRTYSVKPFTNIRVLRQRHIINLPKNAMQLIVTMHVDHEVEFYRFLSVYESHVARYRSGIALTVVVLNLKKGNERHETICKRIENSLKKSREESSSAKHYHYRVLKNYLGFSSHQGRHSALPDLPKTSKLIFTDLNVNLTSDFYFRCRATLVNDDVEDGSMNVYSPIPYSVYRMMDRSKTMPAIQPEINHSNGYWDHENLQTFCLSKFTYEKVGGYDTLIKTKNSWEENKELFRRFVKHKVKIIRSVDPSVYVSYHEIPCKVMEELRYMTSAQCERLRIKSIGTRTMLGSKLAV